MSAEDSSPYEDNVEDAIEFQVAAITPPDDESDFAASQSSVPRLALNPFSPRTSSGENISNIPFLPRTVLSIDIEEEDEGFGSTTDDQERPKSTQFPASRSFMTRSQKSAARGYRLRKTGPPLSATLARRDDVTNYNAGNMTNRTNRLRVAKNEEVVSTQEQGPIRRRSAAFLSVAPELEAGSTSPRTLCAEEEVDLEEMISMMSMTPKSQMSAQLGAESPRGSPLRSSRRAKSPPTGQAKLMEKLEKSFLSSAYYCKTLAEWISLYRHKSDSYISALTSARIMYKNMLLSTRYQRAPNSFRTGASVMVLFELLNHFIPSTMGVDSFMFALKEDILLSIYATWVTDSERTNLALSKQLPIFLYGMQMTHYEDAKMKMVFNSKARQIAMSSTTRLMQKHVVRGAKQFAHRAFYRWRDVARTRSLNRKIEWCIGFMWDRERTHRLKACFAAWRVLTAAGIQRQKRSGLAAIAKRWSEERIRVDARRIAREAYAINGGFFRKYFEPHPENDCQCHGFTSSRLRKTRRVKTDAKTGDNLEALRRENEAAMVAQDRAFLANAKRCQSHSALNDWWRHELHKAYVAMRFIKDASMDPEAHIDDELCEGDRLDFREQPFNMKEHTEVKWSAGGRIMLNKYSIRNPRNYLVLYNWIAPDRCPLIHDLEQDKMADPWQCAQLVCEYSNMILGLQRLLTPDAILQGQEGVVYRLIAQCHNHVSQKLMGNYDLVGTSIDDGTPQVHHNADQQTTRKIEAPLSELRIFNVFVSILEANPEEQMEEIKNTLNSHWTQLRKVFLHYGTLGVTGTLTLNAFRQLLEDCNIIEDITLATQVDILKACATSDATVSSHLARNKDVQVPQKLSDMRRRMAAVIFNAAQDPGQSGTSQSATDESVLGIGIESFPELILRLASSLRMEETYSIAFKINYIVETLILQQGQKADFYLLLSQLRSPQMKVILGENTDYLCDVFSHYCSAEPTLSLKGWRGALKDMCLLDHGLQEPMGDLIHVAISLESGDCLDFEGFQVAMCAVAIFKIPSPWLALNARIQQFFKDLILQKPHSLYVPSLASSVMSFSLASPLSSGSTMSPR